MGNKIGRGGPSGGENPRLTAMLEGLGTHERVARGTYFYKIGQSALPDIILLKKGSVKAGQVTAAGEEHIYNVFSGGCHLFLLSAVTNEPPQLDFIAMTQCDIVRIPHATVRQAILQDGQIAMEMLSDFGKRLAFSYTRLRECESYNTEWKICNLLLSLAGRSGEEYDGKILIREKVSQQTLASMVRVSRITVARTLKNLRDCGLVETVNGHLCIRDEAELIQHMHYISIPLE